MEVWAALEGSVGVHDLPLFLAAALLLNITPGADLLYVTGHAATGGRRAGVLAALGIGAGCLLHVMLATVGLSALLASSDVAFNLLKWAGAGYLIWMGLGMLRARNDVGAPPPVRVAHRVFWRGALTNALNPKVALFFLAFLPQFISPDAARQWLAFALLGLLFTVGGTLVSLGVAWAAGSARERLANRPGSRIGPWLQRAAGVMFVGLGLKLALSGR